MWKYSCQDAMSLFNFHIYHISTFSHYFCGITVNRFFCSILICCLVSGTAFSQVPDTTRVPVADSSIIKDSIIVKDTIAPVKTIDSFSMRPMTDTSWKPDLRLQPGSPLFARPILQHHPYFGFKAQPVFLSPPELRIVKGKELVFYVLVALLIIFGLIRRAFPKYFGDLFRLFFRTTLKQRQIREQLIQTPLPSLLLNGFFVVSGGLYIAFLLKHFQLDPLNNFWLLFLYCCLGLSAAYLVKFIGLKLSGWLFNMNEAANSYIFIVFIVNKMIGMLLLPFLVLLAFTKGDTYTVALTISWCMVAGLIIYRFILTYAAVRNQVKVNPFHFFLYLLAFEVAPLLLVYKGLLFYFSQTA